MLGADGVGGRLDEAFFNPPVAWVREDVVDAHPGPAECGPKREVTGEGVAEAAAGGDVSVLEVLGEATVSGTEVGEVEVAQDESGKGLGFDAPEEAFEDDVLLFPVVVERDGGRDMFWNAEESPPPEPGRAVFGEGIARGAKVNEINDDGAAGGIDFEASRGQIFDQERAVRRRIRADDLGAPEGVAAGEGVLADTHEERQSGDHGKADPEAGAIFAANVGQADEIRALVLNPAGPGGMILIAAIDEGDAQVLGGRVLSGRDFPAENEEMEDEGGGGQEDCPTTFPSPTRDGEHKESGAHEDMGHVGERGDEIVGLGH